MIIRVGQISMVGPYDSSHWTGIFLPGTGPSDFSGKLGIGMDQTRDHTGLDCHNTGLQPCCSLHRTVFVLIRSQSGLSKRVGGAIGMVTIAAGCNSKPMSCILRRLLRMNTVSHKESLTWSPGQYEDAHQYVSKTWQIMKPMQTSRDMKCCPGAYVNYKSSRITRICTGQLVPWISHVFHIDWDKSWEKVSPGGKESRMESQY